MARWRDADPAGGRGASPAVEPSIPRRSRRSARCSAIARAARDLLIEHLHLIQDRYGIRSRRAHLAALADEMRISLAEVYEVATFYAHFDVVKEGERARPAAHGPRLRQHHLRALRRGGASRRSEGGRSGAESASCARPASACATRRRSPRSGIIFCTRRAPATSREAIAARRDPPRHVRRLFDYDAYRAGRRLRAAGAAAFRRDERVDERPDAPRRRAACAASAAPASRRAGSGARCAASPARG